MFRADTVKKISRAKAEWQRQCYSKQKELDQEFKTLSGIPVQALYTPEDSAGLDYSRDLGFPGLEPFTRGVYPTMYRGRVWTQRQLAGFGSPEATNQRLKFLLRQGATGINTVFDYPTLRGYDSTDPFARSDAGRGGVAIDTIDDMRILFEGIPIERVSTSLVTCQPICNISVQSMYFANALNRGIPLKTLSGTSQNDFLMETAITVAPGTLPPEYSFKLSCDAIEFCTKRAPRWNPVSYAGYNYRESGCSAVQEVAFVMANAIACAEELMRRGLRPESFAPRMSFFLSAHSDFFEEVAKYRAARRLWAKIVKKRVGAANSRDLMFRFHVQTAGQSLTAQQPLNNISRAAYQALSAVLGGAQSVHVDAYDEALCTPTELSSLTALRTQQILQHETRVTQTVDPLGGSFFVEALTDQLEQRIEKTIDEIDNLGGIVRAVDQGWVHREIADQAYEHQKRIDAGRLPVVGVNCFQNEEAELPCEIFKTPETLALQEKKLGKIKKTRSAKEVDKVLGDLGRACDKGRNLMEVLVEGVKSFVTEGEITAVLKDHFGIWNPPLF